MINRPLIDTDILINVGRGIQKAIDCLRNLQAQSSLLISVITQMELMIGCQNKSEFQKLERFLSRFQVMPIDEAISAKAVDLHRHYRLSHGLLIADSLIAATALTLEIPLISKNQRDYRYIGDLQLLSYP